MSTHTYLVFGDLHGRVLPAFALACAWQRDHGEPVSALLQVGDVGYFPFRDRLDRATKKHSLKDPLELGALQVLYPSDEADSLFSEADMPGPMWFIAGNHEDYQALNDRYGCQGSTADDFPADAYGRLRCLLSGHVVELPGGLRVGGVWGIDAEAPQARRHIALPLHINPRHARRLVTTPFDVLLTHDSPRDASFVDSGSLVVSELITLARPSFAFYGHYHGVHRLDECDFAPTQVHHLTILDFQGPGHTANNNSVGVLRWKEGKGTFTLVEPAWLRTISRHNWSTRHQQMTSVSI